MKSVPSFYDSFWVFSVRCKPSATVGPKATKVEIYSFVFYCLFFSSLYADISLKVTWVSFRTRRRLDAALSVTILLAMCTDFWPRHHGSTCFYLSLKEQKLSLGEDLSCFTRRTKTPDWITTSPCFQGTSNPVLSIRDRLMHFAWFTFGLWKLWSKFGFHSTKVFQLINWTDNNISRYLVTLHLKDQDLLHSDNNIQSTSNICWSPGEFRLQE